MRERHIPDNIAAHFALFDALTSGPDIVEVAAESDRDIERVAATYFGIGRELALDWLRNQILTLRIDGRWQAIARTTLRDQLHGLQRTLCLQVLTINAPPQEAIAGWTKKRTAAVKHVKQTVNDMRSLAKADFATISVAMQSLRQLAE
jgi:glutamate dehydrogenase